ncbi:MAG: galactokinase, partial [Clostridiales bacterium]|nr:galactokinase [Clostridiales bacterium]
MKMKMMNWFKKIYGDNEGVSVYYAPGRVNLIGEHTDYNGGHVFPCALGIGTYGAVRLRDDNTLRFYSMNF